MWRVFSISLPNSIRKPGITRNTENSEKKIALIRLMAISGPSRNFINIMAMRPPTVVRLLAPISGMALLREMTTASCRSWVMRSSLKRLL